MATFEKARMRFGTTSQIVRCDDCEATGPLCEMDNGEGLGSRSAAWRRHSSPRPARHCAGAACTQSRTLLAVDAREIGCTLTIISTMSSPRSGRLRPIRSSVDALAHVTRATRS